LVFSKIVTTLIGNLTADYDKRICNFLLLISSNLGPVFHRFWSFRRNEVRRALVIESAYATSYRSRQ